MANHKAYTQRRTLDDNMKRTVSPEIVTKREDINRGRLLYQLHAVGLGQGLLALEIWQLPSPATPRLAVKERTASLKGRALELVETRVLRRLKAVGIRLPALKRKEHQDYDLDEDAALNLALMFRTLAPMHNIERIRQVAEGIDQMSREE